MDAIIFMESIIEKLVKERLEEIVERGKIRSKKEQILISTAALLWHFLLKKSVGAKIKDRVESQRKKAGFLFPAIIEVLLTWKEQGREDIIEKIAKMS